MDTSLTKQQVRVVNYLTTRSDTWTSWSEIFHNAWPEGKHNMICEPDNLVRKTISHIRKKGHVIVSEGRGPLSKGYRYVEQYDCASETNG